MVIRVSIVEDSKGEQCDFHCGVTWHSANLQELAAKHLTERFGDQITLDYLDLADPLAEQRDHELISRIKSQGLPLPLLALNGEPRIAGYFDIRMLIDAVEVEQEIHRK